MIFYALVVTIVAVVVTMLTGQAAEKTTTGKKPEMALGEEEEV